MIFFEKGCEMRCKIRSELLVVLGLSTPDIERGLRGGEIGEVERAGLARKTKLFWLGKDFFYTVLHLPYRHSYILTALQRPSGSALHGDLASALR